MSTAPAENRTAASDWAFFVALMATAFAMAGALAHALELPNKMALGRDAYFTVQKIYSGWNQLAYVLALELIGMLAVIYLHRRQRRVWIPALAALAGLVAAQILFWTYTFPANRATGNWVLQPQNWEVLRREWEYSHFAGALCQTWAMGALVIAALRR